MPSVAVTILAALHGVAFIFIFAVGAFYCYTGRVPASLMTEGERAEKRTRENDVAEVVPVPHTSRVVRRDRQPK
ncbi:hypothetical protein DIPPA_18326 [Diplonema papillatum]|nr:hypothetical protein DIPPA_18326 [Diplonema papillatum]